MVDQKLLEHFGKFVQAHDFICTVNIGQAKAGERFRIMYIPYNGEMIIGSFYSYSKKEVVNFGDNSVVITNDEFHKIFVFADKTTEVLYGR